MVAAGARGLNMIRVIILRGKGNNLYQFRLFALVRCSFVTRLLNYSVLTSSNVEARPRNGTSGGTRRHLPSGFRCQARSIFIRLRLSMVIDGARCPRPCHDSRRRCRVSVPWATGGRAKRGSDCGGSGATRNERAFFLRPM